MRTVERAARVGVGAWNDSGVTVARESAMVDLDKGDERVLIIEIRAVLAPLRSKKKKSAY